MEYKTTAGKAVGFDIDLANAIAKNWKVKAKFVETGFPGLLPGLAAKRCTVVISGIFITPDRLAQFPAVAYMKTHRALVVQAGNPKGSKARTICRARRSRCRRGRSTRSTSRP